MDFVLLFWVKVHHPLNTLFISKYSKKAPKGPPAIGISISSPAESPLNNSSASSEPRR
jgi:hypothetical protein